MTLAKLLLVICIAVGVWQFSQGNNQVSLGPEISVTEPPKQTTIINPISFQHDSYQITPLAEFSLQAKVLGRQNYWLDRESDLSPTDLALGWQTMSDETVLSQINISQSNRWYYWQVEAFPIPRRELEKQSANMHIVPADEHVAVLLRQVKSGQVIKLEGQLIKAQAADGWRWQSSLTREDTGAGACELVYVTTLEVIN
ncbi:hypothetical protein LCGC14_1053380 [marine sediment metagenome]|uniref:Uncharacterized protein n=1 Tax=marine sediment metagenome TaxID=412755 RepID=A0A0F9QUA9_9ZZZZ